MKNFLAIYTGSPESKQSSSWDSLDEEARNKKVMQGMEAWGSWGQKYHSSIVSQGGPLGRTKRVTSEGISDIRNNMAAYVIIKAESYELAAQMFLNHPHFSIFPGDGVEIMECLPVPQM